MVQYKKNLKEIVDNMNILIEPSVESSFVIYQDDGETNNYRDGDYYKTEVCINHFEERTFIMFDSTGSYKNYIKNIGCFCPSPRKGGIRSTSLKD